MTFEEFQSLRREVEDLTTLDDMTYGGRGFAYEVSVGVVMTISRRSAQWPAEYMRWQYFLTLDRDDLLSDDLEGLERQLYDWCVEEGFIVLQTHCRCGKAWPDGCDC